jgi:NAD-dependent dihydropyrimidine dehydrogenase PreA subunit
MDVKVTHQDENGKIRQIFNMKDLDVCKIINNLETVPVLKDSITFLNVSCGYCMKPCPSFELKMENGTLSYPTSNIPKDTVSFPNGIIRANVRLYNNRDSNIFTLFFSVKISIANNN